MKEARYVVSFTMVFNLHRVTIVTRGLAKKLSGYIYYQISKGYIGNP